MTHCVPTKTTVPDQDQNSTSVTSGAVSTMTSRFANSLETAVADLARRGITRSLAEKSVEYARHQGSLTIFSVVNALTRLTQQSVNAVDRTALDQTAARLQALAADVDPVTLAAAPPVRSVQSNSEN